MTTTVVARTERSAPKSSLRRYLMCPPTYFAVSYAINAWMDPTVRVDRQRAIEQWSALVAAYRAAGHRVDELTPVDGLPDMVFAANGATVDRRPSATGQVRKSATGGRDRPCTPPGIGATPAATAAGEVRLPAAVNEGEGDFAVLSDCILAGYGFRTLRASS